jgi:hypothetical protein
MTPSSSGSPRGIHRRGQPDQPARSVGWQTHPTKTFLPSRLTAFDTMIRPYKITNYECPQEMLLGYIIHELRISNLFSVKYA